MGRVHLGRALLGAVVALLAACQPLPRHEAFAPGMRRSELVRRFGEPLATQELRKTDAPVWGPIESFWSRVPDGSTVEIWSYRSTQAAAAGRREPGTTELYFVDGADTVQGMGFAPEGAVYEATQPPPP